MNAVQLQQLMDDAYRGSIKAQLVLGMYFYDQGKGEEATQWLSLAATQGSVRAQIFLGLLYSEGTIVPKDERLAVKWLRKAAEQNDPSAQYMLGMQYLDKNGDNPSNDKMTITWLQRSAKQDYVQAQFLLANIYKYGWAGNINKSKAVAWYLKAADRGHRESQTELVFAYTLGEGVQIDLSEGFKWIYILNKTGKLNLDQQELFDNIRIVASPEQQEEGKKRANDWLSLRQNHNAQTKE